MNSEKFPDRDPAKEEEIIESLRTGNEERLKELGGNFIPDKQFLDQEDYLNTTEEPADKKEGEQVEPWSNEKTADDWMNRYEDGILKIIYKNEPSYYVYKVLQEAFPELEVEVKNNYPKKDGNISPDLLTVMVSEDKKIRNKVREILDNPVIELLCAPYGSRFHFDELYQLVETMGFEHALLQKIKARYLYGYYLYEQDHGIPVDSLRDLKLEIESIKEKHLTDVELEKLIINVVEDELEGFNN